MIYPQIFLKEEILMVTAKFLLCAILPLTALGLLAGRDVTWAPFTQMMAVSFLRPSGWSVEVSEKVAVVLSPSRSGAVGQLEINDNQARIVVRDESFIQDVKEADVVAMYATSEDPAWDGSIAVISDKRLSSDGTDCAALREVVVLMPTTAYGDVPAGLTVPRYVHTNYFCTSRNGRVVSVLLTSWEDDKDIERYKAIATRLYKSLKFRI